MENVETTGSGREHNNLIVQSCERDILIVWPESKPAWSIRMTLFNCYFLNQINANWELTLVLLLVIFLVLRSTLAQCIGCALSTKMNDSLQTVNFFNSHVNLFPFILTIMLSFFKITSWSDLCCVVLGTQRQGEKKNTIEFWLSFTEC